MKNNKRKVFIGVILITLIMLLICIFLVFSKETTYKVTFDSMGGSSTDEQIVKEGESVIKPTNPQKEGFTFVEWQLNNSTYDFNTMVTNDIKLTAYYTINEGIESIQVKLDYQNGEEINVVEIVKGGLMVEPPQPQKEGYKFIGWYLDENKFDFTANIHENIVLIANWEENEKPKLNSNDENDATTPSVNRIENKEDNNTTDKNEEVKENIPTNTIDDLDFRDIINKYSGIWYLEGYSDVYLSISETSKDITMDVQAINFALPLENPIPNNPVAPYSVYPYKNFLDLPTTNYWNGGFEIFNDANTWESSLSKHKMVIGDNCVYINNKKFVRSKGTKDQYSDTCYRHALGTWYLSNNPNSTLNIYLERDYGLPCGHYFNVEATNFDIFTFSTNSSHNVVSGWAGRRNNWEQYGISVNGDKLTISNSNGTREFYKTKTYKKVTGITLDTTDISLGIGETKTIKATISPFDAYDKTVTWNSSNSAVATVSPAGVITAKGEGTTIITANTKDSNYTASCKVTVSVVHVNGISIDKKSLNMTVGDIHQLSYTISPSNAANKNVSWSSNNESVVQVSSTGKITAKGKGSATITIRTDDGGYTATCSITVQEPELKVSTSIGMGYYMSDSGSARGVFAKVTPSGGSGNYVVYSIKLYYNGSLVAESSKNEVVVTPIKNGTYTAEVYVKDSSGNEVRDTKTTTISN